MKKTRKFLLFLCVYLIVSAITYAGGVITDKLKRPQPAFSVVMTTYNRADKLPRVIASVLNQTYKDFEFVILDDGSTDSTQEVLSSLAAQDSRIRLIKNEKNKGIPYSRNRLIKEARGKFITNIDSDDMMYQNLLQDVADYLSQNPETDIIYGNHLITWDEKGCIHPIRDKWPILIFENNIFQNSGVTYRREFVEKNHISYDETFSVAEDYDFWLQMITKGAQVGYIDSDLVCYEWGHKNSGYWENTARYRLGSLKKLYRFLGLPETDVLPLCETARKFQEKHLPFLTEKEWNREFGLSCGIFAKETTIMLKHINWSGEAVINESKTRIRRLGFIDEGGSILSYSPDEITVKWDHWGKETFVRKKENVFQVQ